MSKTIEDIGLIVGGIALAFFGVEILPFFFTLSAATIGGIAATGVATALAGTVGLLLPAQPPIVQNGQLAVNNPVAFRRVCYGLTGVNAGVPTFADYPLGSAPYQNSGYDFQWLHLVYTLTGHQIEQFLAVIIDGTYYPMTGASPTLQQDVDGYWKVVDPSSNYFDAASSSSKGGYNTGTLIAFEFDVGDPTNSAQPFPGLDAASTLWTGLCLQRGCAKVHVAFRFCADIASNPNAQNPAPFNPYASGRIPKLQFEIIGKPVLDTRLTTELWQANTLYEAGTFLIDPAGNQQQAQITFTSGNTQPIWNESPFGFTSDGGTPDAWENIGAPPAPYSNPALCIYDYLTSTDYGLGVPAASIDLSTVNAAANICQDLIAVPAPPGPPAFESFFSCDGMFEESSSRGSILKALADSMGGFVVPPGDQWRIFAGVHMPPEITLTDVDLRDSIKSDWRLSRRDVANGVKGKLFPRFLPIPTGSPLAHSSATNSATNWQETDFPPYQANGLLGHPDYLFSEDGGQVIWKDITLPFTTSMWACQRLAKIQLMQLRFQVTLTLKCKLSAYQLQAGDSVLFVHSRWQGATPPAPTEFIVQQISLSLEANSGGAPTLGVDLVLRQNDPSIYSFGFGEYLPYLSTGFL